MSELIQPNLAQYVEASLVRPEATRQDIERLCAEARRCGCRGVCVNGSRVLLASSLLEDTGLKVTALVGYPLGAMDSDVKRYETEVAIDHGAHEIEMVLGVGQLKDGDRPGVLRELRDIAEAADERPVKVLLETHLLTPEEIALACELALDSGVHAVGTGTVGPSSPAAGIEIIQRLRALVGEKFGVKAVGDLADGPSAQALIDAGASRLGLTGLAEWVRYP